MIIPPTLKGCAIAVLNSSSIAEKVNLSLQFSTAWKEGLILHIFDGIHDEEPIPDSPARPIIGKEINPKEKGYTKNSIEISIHGIAHAESYAIDLFWDCLARFSHVKMPKEFFDDIVRIAAEEAHHCKRWMQRLEEFGCPYGTLSVHDGLWRAASQTAENCNVPKHLQLTLLSCLCLYEGDLRTRLAVINLVHEARGLDTFPLTLARLRRAGDKTSELILCTNFEEEVRLSIAIDRFHHLPYQIGHVAAGVRWFTYLHENPSIDTRSTFQSGQIKSQEDDQEDREEDREIHVESDEASNASESVSAAFRRIFLDHARSSGAHPTLSGPFNLEARARAGLTEEWYMPLTLVATDKSTALVA